MFLIFGHNCDEITIWRTFTLDPSERFILMLIKIQILNCRFFCSDNAVWKLFMLICESSLSHFIFDVYLFSKICMGNIVRVSSLLEAFLWIIYLVSSAYIKIEWVNNLKYSKYFESMLKSLWNPSRKNENFY